MMVDNMGHPAHLHARETSRVLVSRAPLAKIEPFKKRMGWTVPWFSSFDSDFNQDFGVTTDEGETFGLSVFLLGLRQRSDHTDLYLRTRRRIPGSSYLDLTPFGRQEVWYVYPKGLAANPAV